jgi:glutathione peroxidase
VQLVILQVDVLGPSAHPLFNYLNTKAPNPNGKQAITMNYEKFLIDAQGKLVTAQPVFAGI